MGLFVSRHAEHTIMVRTEQVEWVRGRNNEVRRMVSGAPIYAQFRNFWWMLTDPQKIQALSAFNKNTKYVRNIALGDLTHKLTITEDGPAAETIGDRPEMHYGVFNSDVEWKEFDEETRADLVAELMANPEYGHSFISVDEIPIIMPWPTYDELETATEIVAVMKAAGFDPAMVIVYEKANKNRADVIEAIEASLVAEVEREAEDASLSTTA